MEKALINILREKSVSEDLISDVIASGYFLKTWVNPFEGKTYTTVSDKMYGNKQFSSSFEIEKFIKYIHGENTFENYHKFKTYTVKTKNEINEILNQSPRKNYISEEKMSFRGQPKEYKIKRKIPNPVRCDEDGNELSILPGAYRNKSFEISLPSLFDEMMPRRFLSELEPNNPNVLFDSSYSHDIMRVQQHYANQTEGLDISFNIDTAIFFATHKLNTNSNGSKFYTKIDKGNHDGVIYCFVFRDPPVKKTQYYIDSFSLFKTYTPERILRQRCGLPLFSDYDRNIAICDIDCIIYLDKDFEDNKSLAPEYMFPSREEDKFYHKLLELKDKYKNSLNDVVVYEHQ